MQDDIVRRPPQETQAPVLENAEIPVAAAPTTEPVADTTPPEQVTETPVEPNSEAPIELQESAKKSAGRAKPVGIILVAVVICLGLVGGVIYLGMHDSKKPITKKATTSSTQAVSKDPVSTSKTVDGVNAALDEASTIPADTTDVSTDLGDAALGL